MPTKIEWADSTWNILTGCSPISAGCKNCYAKRMAHRLCGRFGYRYNNPFGVTFHEDRLEQPYRWKKPQRVFVCSMGDMFHDDVRYELQLDILNVIEENPRHTFMILTKRPENMHHFFEAYHSHGHFNLLPNLWLGVTVENEAVKEERLRWLMRCEAQVRFVSVEPMLSAVDFWKCNRLPDWVICGAETGPGKRPMDINWARDLRDQCRTADVPFFFKKDSTGGSTLYGSQWRQFPEDQ